MGRDHRRELSAHANSCDSRTCVRGTMCHCVRSMMDFVFCSPTMAMKVLDEFFEVQRYLRKDVMGDVVVGVVFICVG